MKISLKALSKFVKIDLPANQLVELIGSRLVEVEEVLDLRQKYQNIIIVEVKTAEKIAGTHLSLCQIVKDQTSEPIQVVCGAPNVRAGMLAVWLSPGNTVPSTYNTDSPFVLSAKNLRGHLSNGMLASLAELDLGSDHSGIVEIDPKFAKAGDDFGALFELDDIILDIENKSLTHRPDCFGLIGFAREVAGILNQKFQTPDFLYHETVFPENFLVQNDMVLSSKNCPLTVEVKDNSLCSRYSCAVVELNPKPTSNYLNLQQVFLAKHGINSVSEIVDLTNLLMLETGQPLHAFDYDKVLKVANTSNPTISVRLAKPSEQTTLLNQKTITLNPNDIVITANDEVIALAGAMGSDHTKVDEDTTRILLESATFNLYNLRKTQMNHGLFTEAITRFTKGIPPDTTFTVLAEFIKLLGTKPLAVYDFYANYQTPKTITLSPREINSLLGTDYSPKIIIDTLDNVGISLKQKPNQSPTDDSNLDFLIPIRRPDLNIKADLIEEVARLNGYDNINKVLPKRNFSTAKISPLLELKRQIRNLLSDNLFANETLTYSFVSQDLLEKMGLEPSSCFEIVNSISPKLQFFRPLIVPSLLDKIYQNLRAGHTDFALYEQNQVAIKPQNPTTNPSSHLKNHLALIELGDFYQAKAKLSFLLTKINLDFSFVLPDSSLEPYFEPHRSAFVVINGETVGEIGELKVSTLAKFKLKSPITAFELNLDKIVGRQNPTATNFKSQKFPSVERDLTLLVLDKSANYEDIFNAISNSLPLDLEVKFAPISIYQKTPADQISYTFRFKISHPDKTLTAPEVSDIIENITKNLKEKISFSVI